MVTADEVNFAVVEVVKVVIVSNGKNSLLSGGVKVVIGVVVDVVVCLCGEKVDRFVTLGIEVSALVDSFSSGVASFRDQSPF